jgi:hypothetical protein
MRRLVTRAAQRALVALALASTLAGASACGDDDTVMPADAGATIDGGGGACESFPTENAELLNAPTTATVIRKTPSHPPIGDAGLP